MVDNIAMKSKPDTGRCAHARLSRLLPIFRRYGEIWRCMNASRCGDNGQMPLKINVPRTEKQEVFFCAQSPAFRKIRALSPDGCEHRGRNFPSSFPRSPLYECICTGECGYGKAGAGIVRGNGISFCGANPAIMEENARAKLEK